jgi:hypothetical protein
MKMFGLVVFRLCAISSLFVGPRVQDPKVDPVPPGPHKPRL